MCNILELESSILQAICNILELEPFILPAICSIWSWNLPFCLLFVAFWSWNLPFCLLFAAFWSWNLAFGMLSASRCWLLVVVFSLWVGVPGGTHQQLLMAWFLFGCRQCLWFPYACGFGCGEHQQSHEVNKPSIKALQSQEQRKLAKQSRPEKTQKQNKSFEWYVQYFQHSAMSTCDVEIEPLILPGICDIWKIDPSSCMVLQNFADDNCNMFER